MIPCKAKLIIYKSSILLHLTYCHLVWHSCRSSDSSKIERIQERTLRAVFNSHSESYENLLVRTELPSLLNRRLQDITILMYKVKYGLAPSIVNKLFEQKSTYSYSLKKKTVILIFRLLTLLTMENILLDIKELIYGRN